MPSKKSKQKLKNISERGYSTVSAPRKRQEEVEDLKAQNRLVRAVLSARQGGVSLRVAPSRVDGASSATARLSAGDGAAACASAAPESEVHAESEVRRPACEPGPATERLEGDDLFKLDEEAAQAAPLLAASSAGRESSTSAPASYAAAISPVLRATPSVLPSSLGAHSPRSGPVPVPERQRSDRAWNPEDAARSIPLQRFPAFQAHQDELLEPSATLSSAGGASSAAAAEEEEAVAVAVAAADEEAAAAATAAAASAAVTEWEAAATASAAR